MTDEEQRAASEAFKERLLKWQNVHEEEYGHFTRLMQSQDCSGYISFFKQVVKYMPQLEEDWSRAWNSDGMDGFDDIMRTVMTSGFPKSLLDDFALHEGDPPPKKSLKEKLCRLIGIKPKPKVRLSAPLILCWLYNGRGFESIYETLTRQMQSRWADGMDKEKCMESGLELVKTSMDGGFRTQEKWDEYFRRKKVMDSGDMSGWVMENAFRCSGDTSGAGGQAEPESREPKVSGRRKSGEQPLINYLSCGNREAVIAVIRQFVIANYTANCLALPFFALEQLEFFTRVIDAKEYSTGLARQFADLGNLKSESSCRQALGNLRRRQFVIIGGKQCNGTLLESDEYAPRLERLKTALSEASCSGQA